MAIQARCTQCGAGIKAGDKYAGQRVKCPKCGGAILVPAAESPSTDEIELMDTEVAGQPQPAVPVSAPATAVVAESDPFAGLGGESEAWRKAVAKKKPRQSSSGRPAWLIPAVGGGICAVAVVGAVGIFVLGGSDEVTPVEMAQNAPAVDAPSAMTEVALADSRRATVQSADNGVASSTPAASETEQMVVRGKPTPQPVESEPATPAPTETPVTPVATIDSPLEEPVAPAKPEMKAASEGSDALETSVAAAPTEVPSLPPNVTPEDVFTEHGLRVVGDQVALVDESTTALRGSIRDAQKLRVALTKSFAETMRLERLQQEMKLNRGKMAAALAQVNSVPQNAQSVQANNALVGQLQVLETKLEQAVELSDKAHQKLAESREAYIKQLLDTREKVKGIEEEYTTLKENPQIMAALAAISKSTGKEVVLEPTGNFLRTERDLAELERQILSDTIVARMESGNLFVSTMVNNEHTIEMIVDSGASIVTLPYDVAVGAGLKPKPSDPVAQFQIADGSLITGQIISIPTLRVGKFTLENVEAAVLGPEAINATPLLGMSYLGKFEVKIDSKRGELILSKIEGVENAERVR